ncbi:DUF6281 family protein [Streptomyces sp. NPDC060198]|uniref:DUF6281 family protein n=1 Tax=Streptomyces sp. NPDC060198 TaxID=3347070 RepID=UPI0036663655
MRGTRRSAGWLGAAVMVLSTAACTASGGGGEASCVANFTYQDRSYWDAGKVDFTVGEKLGAAASTPCYDTGDRGKSEEPPTETETAYTVVGVSPELAIAVGDTPESATFFAVHSDAEGAADAEFPPEVRKLIDGS